MRCGYAVRFELEDLAVRTNFGRAMFNRLDVLVRAGVREKMISCPHFFKLVVVWVGRKMGIYYGYAVRWILKSPGRLDINRLFCSVCKETCEVTRPLFCSVCMR